MGSKSASRSGARRMAGAERDRLYARRVRETEERQEERDPERLRAFEGDHEDEDEGEEERVEGVLRHHRAGVGERRNGDGEQGCEQRVSPGHHAPREEERRNRRERHEHRVPRLHRRVGSWQGVEERVRRADQQGIDDAVAGIGLVAQQRLTRICDAAGDLRPDDLVDDDERRDQVAGQPGADRRRSDDDRRQPGPGRYPRERSTQARPRRGGGRSPSPRPSPPRSRPPPPPR